MSDKELPAAGNDLGAAARVCERLLATVRDAFLLYDPSGRIVDANVAATESYGYSREELLRLSVTDIRAAAANSTLESDWQSAAHPDGTVFETIHRRKDGSTFLVEVSAGSLELDGATYRSSFVRDITKRKQLIDEAQMAWLASIDGHWVVDGQARFLRVNDAYCRMIGYSVAELLAMRISDVEFAETAPETAAHLAAVMRDGGDRFESRHRRKDGTILDVEISATCPPGGGDRVFAFVRDITDRNRLAALSALQEFSIETQADAMHWMTADGRMFDVNAAACEQLGYTREELRGARLADLDGRWDAEAWAKHFTELRQCGRLRFEFEQLHRDGHFTPVEIVANYVKFADLELNVATVRDVSLRKKAEEALRSSEARLRDAQRVSKVGSWETDLSTLDVVWSDQVFAMFDLDPDTFKASHPAFLEFVHPDDRRKVDDAFSESFGSTASNVVEHRIITAKGATKHVEERWRIVRDAKQQPVRAVGTCQDITERMLAELVQQDAQRRLSAILETVSAPIFVKDNDHRIILANRAFASLFGLEVDAILGHSLAESVPAEEREQFLAVDRRVLDTGTTDRREETLTVHGITRTIITTKSRLIDGSGSRFLVGSIDDITNRKQASAALEHQLDELRRWQAVMLDREDRIQQLKGEVNDLACRLGEPVKYASREALLVASADGQGAGAPQ